jgi:hypothetical protein
MSNLNILYRDLDFNGGSLFPAIDTPSLCPKQIDWLEKGEWLAAAKRAGAENVFFVENNPVAVFAECGADFRDKIKAFNKVWCLARPRLLFLASPGEITVYDLAQRPIDENREDDWQHLTHLAVLHDLGKVSAEFQKFHRDNIESGHVFGDERFGDLKNRADQALIRDLKTVRRELISAGLSGENVRFAHALIGRSIFVRYLEDRGVLTEKYFKNIAGQKAGWTELLRKPAKRAGADLSNKETYYPSVLQDKEFTYALFKKLARDFNGDMFPEVHEEELLVTQKHLTLIKDLLYGDAGVEKKLFFYSYRFEIVPLELISSIYEEFYHSSTSDDEKKSKARQDGAYYTPPVLAEFVLSRILTLDTLKRIPRVLDPACGSGIFLVESFRRIVRYEWHKKQQALTFDELKDILKQQITGIEVNEEAARITAFSLYLSMLHYLDPPAIDQQIKMGNRLPNLLVATQSRSANHFNCILPGNAFDVNYIESNPMLKERFGNGCADVIVGNPPWGAPGNKADQETKSRQEIMLAWCTAQNKPIGDKEPSQAFLWRALDLLKEGGKAGMLVSAGVLFKHSSTTQAFRKQWLEAIRLDEVFNFSHVRAFFFKSAVSPFIAISFIKEKQAGKPIYYWSIKQLINIQKTQTLVLSKYDLNIIRNEQISDYSIWKQFWFGRYADRDLLNYLKTRKRLVDFVDRKKSGQGYKVASQDNDASVLKSYRSLVIASFSRYDQPKFADTPDKLHRLGVLEVYEGSRLLVQRGINEEGVDKGKIVARYDCEPYCFTNAINGIKLISNDETKYKTVLGIIWSSFSRYFLFMISANWGLWHHEIHLNDELLQLPIVFDENSPATNKIINAVNNLRNYSPQKTDVLNLDGVAEDTIISTRQQWERELDEAVFELYGLSEEQKDLIRDCCDVTLPFFYKPFDSIGTMPAIENKNIEWFEANYIRIFCKRWNIYLGTGEEMRAEIHVGAHGNMVAIEFYPADKGDSWNLKPQNNTWGYILEQLGNNLPQPMGTSQIVLDGLVHVVSKDGIIIIKRNEKRFWTRSLSREDADVTLYKRMVTTMPKEERPR